MLPFPAVFGMLGKDSASFGYVIIQIIRLTYISRLYSITKLKWLQDTIVLKNTFVLFYTYALLTHLMACLWIYIGYSESDFNNSWLSEIPTHEFEIGNLKSSFDVDAGTVYLYAVYWSIAALTYVGAGDVTGINPRENMVVGLGSLVSCFLFSFFMGIMTRVFEDIARKVVKNYQFARKAVNEYVNGDEFTPFIEKIEQYFSYAWMENRAVNENALLYDLPPTIRIDMQFSRYKDVLMHSDFFKADLQAHANKKLIRSFLKVAKYEVFMTDEYIISAGKNIELKLSLMIINKI